jgi:hypothetical protein
MWFLSAALAFAIPSPQGYWSAGSIFLWGMVGDPHGPGEPWASVLGGAALLTLYTCAIRGIIGALVGQFSRSRAEQTVLAGAVEQRDEADEARDG